MKSKTILIAACNHYTSPYQVGSQQIARTFRRLGWNVIYVSDPVSLIHLFGAEKKLIYERFRIAFNNENLSKEGIWYSLPLALLPPKNIFFLRSNLIAKKWFRTIFLNWIKKVKRKIGNNVDILYIDSVVQEFWINGIEYDKLIFRVADNNRAYGNDYPVYKELEERIASKADLTLYTSVNLLEYLNMIKAKNSYYFPNGVEYPLFTGKKNSEPKELGTIPHPRVIYIGETQLRFNKKLIKYAANELPEFSFIIVGNTKNLEDYFKDLSNIYLLGYRNYYSIPAFIQNSDIGIIPFKTHENLELLEYINPIKLYQYFASGIPVISADWEGIRKLNSPAYLYKSNAEFIDLLLKVSREKLDSNKYQKYAANLDWAKQVNTLIRELGFE